MNWIAYAATDEARHWEVYIQPFGQSGGAVWRVSRSGGRHPRWSGDGRELFYVTPDGALMSASVSAEPAFRITQSRHLFEQAAMALDFNNPLSYSRYDVTRDGKRFRVRVPAESGMPRSDCRAAQLADAAPALILACPLPPRSCGSSV